MLSATFLCIQQAARIHIMLVQFLLHYFVFAMLCSVNLIMTN